MLSPSFLQTAGLEFNRETARRGAGPVRRARRHYILLMII
jgi:hypothetical protein